MDDKIKKALSLFAEGKNRNEVSKLLGYKNYKVLDMFFRRRNYRWNANQGTYVIYEEPESLDKVIQDVVISKAQQIIALLSVQDKDPKEAAKQAGFSNIQQMADYMTERGFSWDCGRNNYVRNTGIVKDTADNSGGIDETEVRDTKNSVHTGKEKEAQLFPPEFSNYLNLLSFLQMHKEKLIDLLTIKQDKKLPRYVIAGSCTAKSMQIPIVLDKIVKDFSAEKNVSQKDILTVALIEFLIKYGYDVEVEYMLNAGRI